MTDIDGLFTLSAPVRLAFPDALFTPRAFEGKGDPKYDAMFVFPDDHPDLPAIRALVKAIAQGAFPGLTPAELQLPWKTGAEVIAASAAAAARKGKKAPENNDWLEGTITITARSQYAPLLNAIVNGKLVKYRDDVRPTAKDRFYFGANVIAELNFASHKVGSNKPGVTAYLNELVATGGGDRIAGGKPTEEKFNAYLGNVSQVDPSAGAPASGDGW